MLSLLQGSRGPIPYYLALAICSGSLGMTTGCGGDSDASPDAGTPTDAAGQQDAGVTLADAGPPADAGFDAGPPCDGPPGLYVDPECQQVAPDVVAYSPQFWLWSDATDKERFISLPEESTIDTSDPDGWVFPVGTRIWKTFSLREQRLETRLLEKVRPGRGLASWSVRTFAWDEFGIRVVEVVDGVVDALGTYHDIPPVAACADCHEGGGQPDVVLGFGSIQLNHDDAGIRLEDLNESRRLSQPVSPGLAAVPGESVDQVALGYLHANCGHCHGGPEPEADLDLFLRVGRTTVEATETYRTTVGVASTWPPPPGSGVRITPGNPDLSTLFQRMGERDGAENQMPPLATDLVDPMGRAQVSAWIQSL